MTRYFTVGFGPQYSLRLSSLRILSTGRQARGPLVVAVADGLALLLPAAASCALRPAYQLQQRQHHSGVSDTITGGDVTAIFVCRKSRTRSPSSPSRCAVAAPHSGNSPALFYRSPLHMAAPPESRVLCPSIGLRRYKPFSYFVFHGPAGSAGCVFAELHRLRSDFRCLPELGSSPFTFCAEVFTAADTTGRECTEGADGRSCTG